MKKCDCTLEKLLNADPDEMGSPCVRALQEFLGERERASLALRVLGPGNSADREGTHAPSRLKVRSKPDHFDHASDGDLDLIRTWRSTASSVEAGSWVGLLEFMETIWPDYGVVRKNVSIRKDSPTEFVSERRWEFVTGGWSGCEAIINAFYDNALAHACLWESSHRGGLHVLLEPDKASAAEIHEETCMTLRGAVRGECDC